MQHKYMSPAQLRQWTGNAADFKTPLTTSLAFRGLQQQDLLREANYTSLAHWVTDQLRDIASEESDAPEGLTEEGIAEVEQLRSGSVSISDYALI